jgi:hypothetical protein
MLKKFVPIFFLFGFTHEKIGSLPVHPVRPATSRGGETGHGWGHKMQIVTSKGNVNYRSTFLCESKQFLNQPECCKAGARFECRHLSQAFWVTCESDFKGSGVVITPSFRNSTREPLPRPLWVYGYIPEGSVCQKGKVLALPLLGNFKTTLPKETFDWPFSWPASER